MTSTGTVINIDNKTLLELLEKETAIIDIRREEEWKETGIIYGSYLLTLFNENKEMINPEEWVKKVGRLVPIDKAVILLCRLGNRTIPACQLLADAGYSKVYNVTAGITAWIAEGMPIEKYNLR